QVLAKLRAKGADMIDAPVFGSKNEAEKGELGFIVGATPEVLARVQDVLDAMGRTIHVGGNSLGASAKLVMNLIVACTLEAFNEGLVLATKAGVDPATMLKIILSSRARAGIIDMKAAPVLQRDFTTFFPLQLMAKDMRLVAETAASLGLELPFASAINRVFASGLADGLAEQDFSAMIKVLEKQAGVEVKSNCPLS
ncbi:MAG TPA: NAD(P)-dependent oxidoreductase, partial [Chthoniobacteraceae bacterium]